MDKKAWIVIIACSLGLYFWLDTQKEYQKKLQEETANVQQTSESINQEEEGSSNKEKNPEDDSKTNDFVEGTPSFPMADMGAAKTLKVASIPSGWDGGWHPTPLKQ